MGAEPTRSLAPLLGNIRDDLRRSFAALVVFEALFKVATALVILPGLAVVLFHLARAGNRTAVTNEDILAFLLSPAGVCYCFLLGLKVLGLSVLEHAGVMALAAMKQTGHWHGTRHAVVALAMRTAGLLRLTGEVLLLAVAVLAPFVGLAVLTYVTLLGAQDINYYLADRPPRFIVACAIGAVLFGSAMALSGWLLVRWAFAVPIVLFEGGRPLAALRQSAARTRGARGRLALVLLTWFALGWLLQIAVVAAFKLFAAGLLHSTGARPGVLVPEVATLLVVKGLLLAILSSFFVVVQALLIQRLYVERSVAVAAIDPEHWDDPLEDEPARPSRLLHRLEWGLAGVGVGLGVLYLALTLPFSLTDTVEVTAHRGFSAAAPENTLAAVRKAIAAGADWAEIDVQLTADDEVVVVHDFDLRRLTGDPRRVAEVKLAELRQMPFKLKPQFREEFGQERIPTLKEVLDLARGNIKLNIELKFKGADRRLAKKVAELLRQEEFEERCFVASLTYDGVVLAKKHNPRLRTAAIVTAAAGDISGLDVDVLSVKSNLATPALLRRAHRLGKQVHVWKVDEPDEMRRQIEHGVDNIITDEPGRCVEIRRERAGLGDAQRLLLACRYLLE